MRSLPLLLVLLAAPAFAADLPNPNGSNACETGCAAFAGITFGIDLVVDIVDLAVFASGGSLTPGWIVVQGLWGLGHVIAGTIVSAVGGLGLSINSPGAGVGLALGLVALGEGILLIIIAIASTVHSVRERRRLEEERRHPSLVPQVSFSVDPRGGASTLLAWRF
jgi:hypothetical protein